MPRIKEPKANVGERLVELATQSLDPFVSTAGEVYVLIPVAGAKRGAGAEPDASNPPHIAARVDDADVVDWLRKAYYRDFGHDVVSERQVRDALGVVKSLTLEQPERYEVPVRLYAKKPTTPLGAVTLYLDLGDPSLRMVKVELGRWSVVENAGKDRVRFRRPSGMQPLPVPTPHTGHVCRLREFLNCPGSENDENFYRLMAWLLGSIMPDGDRPVLVLNGAKGSGKSTIARALRNLIDPSEADLLQPFKTEEVMALRAYNSWVLAYDNYTHLSDMDSDALCRMSTGSAFAKRKHYENEKEVIWNLQRPVIITGISKLAVKDDLSQRAFEVDLPEIPDTSADKFTRTEYEAAFEDEHADLLSALLDVVAAGMERLYRTSADTTERFRMGDVHLFVTACEEPLGWERGTATNIMRRIQECSRAAALTNVSFISELVEFMHKRPPSEYGQRTYTSTRKELVKALREQAYMNGLNVNDRTVWPQTEQAATRIFTRYIKELRGLGISQQGAGVKDGYPRYTISLGEPESKSVKVPPWACKHHPTDSDKCSSDFSDFEKPKSLAKSLGLSPDGNRVCDPSSDSVTSVPYSLCGGNRYIADSHSDTMEGKGEESVLLSPNKVTESLNAPRTQKLPGLKGSELVSDLHFAKSLSHLEPAAPVPQVGEVTQENAAWAKAYSLLPICPNLYHRHGTCGMSCNTSGLPNGLYNRGFVMPTGTIQAVHDGDGRANHYDPKATQGYIRAQWAEEAAALYLRDVQGETLGPRLAEKLAALDERMERERRKLACEHSRWEEAKGRFGGPIWRCLECGGVLNVDVPLVIEQTGTTCAA